MVGISASQLKGIPEVIAIPYGDGKLKATLAALRSGLVHSLVTHAALASALLEAGSLCHPDCRRDVRMTDHLHEIPLEGGIANRGRVVRVGRPCVDPFDRPAAQLTHSCSTSVEMASMVLRNSWVSTPRSGILSYIRNRSDSAISRWALTDAALVSVALLLRRYHEAVVDFDSQVIPGRSPLRALFRRAD